MAWHLLNTVNAIIIINIFFLISWILTLSNRIRPLLTEEFQLHHSLHYYPISRDGVLVPYIIRPLFQTSISQSTGRGRGLVKLLATHPLLPQPQAPGSEMTWTACKSIMGPASAVPPIDRRGQQCVGNSSGAWKKGWEERGEGRVLPRTLCVGWKDDHL